MGQEIALHIIGYTWTVVIALLSIIAYGFCLNHDKK